MASSGEQRAVSDVTADALAPRDACDVHGSVVSVEDDFAAGLDLLVSAATAVTNAESLPEARCRCGPAAEPSSAVLGSIGMAEPDAWLHNGGDSDDDHVAEAQTAGKRMQASVLHPFVVH